MPIALGLFVGLQSLWGRRYLQERLAGFDREMDCASLDLLNRLSRKIGRIRWATPEVSYLEAYVPNVAADAKFRRRCQITGAGLVFVSWWIESLLRLDLRERLLSVVVILICACPFVYPFWVGLLRRRPAGAMVIAAALCLCWCGAELLSFVLP